MTWKAIKFDRLSRGNAMGTYFSGTVIKVKLRSVAENDYRRLLFLFSSPSLLSCLSATFLPPKFISISVHPGDGLFADKVKIPNLGVNGLKK